MRWRRRKRRAVNSLLDHDLYRLANIARLIEHTIVLPRRIWSLAGSMIPLKMLITFKTLVALDQVPRITYSYITLDVCICNRLPQILCSCYYIFGIQPVQHRRAATCLENRRKSWIELDLEEKLDWKKYNQIISNELEMIVERILTFTLKR